MTLGSMTRLLTGCVSRGGSLPPRDTATETKQWMAL